MDSAIEMTTLKTVLYMGTLHGFFTFYFPYQLASRDKQLFDIGVFHLGAFPLWILGTFIIIQCSVAIVHRGRGTPAHLDPPKELVIKGWYRYVRNPIYFGALLVQAGYILWFDSALSMMYAVFMFSGFHFLVLIEEPILRNTFGSAYDEYCKKVPRWIPRWGSNS